ncbi:MAG: hypothetical protein RLN88_08935 [Ekhidna sp.]|uniref:hypothetical protein n=1 Tax=Ekhidna sp. TaxID=2608089 RepID=UPI0032ED1AD9
MKITLQIILAALVVFSCQPTEEKKIAKYWQGQPVEFSNLKEVVNTYHMFDSTDTKVGSMVFGFSFENGFLVARDTSQFDNGSVYETAELIFDTSNFTIKKVAIDFQLATASLDVDLRNDNGRIIGSYTIIRDTIETPNAIDSAYQFTTFREEIYMLAHTLNLKSGDTLSLQALVPTSMAVSNTQMYYAGTETIETINGMEECDVVWLKADGRMPDNKIWISQAAPRTIMKFYVPGAELDIELVSQK